MLLQDCKRGCKGYGCNTASLQHGNAVRCRAVAGEAKTECSRTAAGPFTKGRCGADFYDDEDRCREFQFRRGTRPDTCREGVVLRAVKRATFVKAQRIKLVALGFAHRQRLQPILDTIGLPITDGLADPYALKPHLLDLA
jgi:hypothetical protein